MRTVDADRCYELGLLDESDGVLREVVVDPRREDETGAGRVKTMTITITTTVHVCDLYRYQSGAGTGTRDRVGVLSSSTVSVHCVLNLSQR